MRRFRSSTITKFTAGFLFGAILFSGSAFAYTSYISDNTPQGGYLLCANKRTKAVTFPDKLNCPSGTTALDLGALTGLEGPTGPQGPAGDPLSSTAWFGSVSSKDIAGTAGATSFSNLKKTIMATISSTTVYGGENYSVTASLSGIWASQSPANAYIKCYFQYASEFPNGSTLYGAASTSRTSWTGIDLVVHGNPSDFSLGTSAMHLVCATDGVVSGLSGYLRAISTGNLKVMNNTNQNAS
jgi:hypothetical protein